MAGLLDGYGINMDEVEAPSFEVPDDIYEFEVSDFYLRQGTDSKPDAEWLIIQFNLGENGKQKSEWFQLPSDPANPTDKELEKLGYYKNRLKDLGITEGFNEVGPDDLIGITGTLQVYTKNGYQNIKNVKASASEGPNAFSPKEQEAPKGRAAVAEKPVAARRAAATTEARSAGVAANPFRNQ